MYMGMKFGLSPRRKEHGFRVFVLQGLEVTFRPKGEKVIGRWRNL